MPRILVIDDDQAVRTAISLVLEREGFEVEIVGDGRAGVAAMAKAGFDIVIVDLFMPGMDGLETIKAFNQTAPSVPIIAMSGILARQAPDAAPDFLRMATTFGAVHSLHKPFRPNDLLQAVEKCLSDRRKPPAGNREHLAGN
jgi:CheY-like chemotaxis protein